MKRNKEINLNQTGPESFDIPSCMVFNHYFQSFISRWEARQQVLCLPNFESFGTLLNFPKTYASSQPGTHEATYRTCYMWKIEAIL